MRKRNKHKSRYVNQSWYSLLPLFVRLQRTLLVVCNMYIIYKHISENIINILQQKTSFLSVLPKYCNSACSFIPLLPRLAILWSRESVFSCVQDHWIYELQPLSLTIHPIPEWVLDKGDNMPDLMFIDTWVAYRNLPGIRYQLQFSSSQLPNHCFKW